MGGTPALPTGDHSLGSPQHATGGGVRRPVAKNHGGLAGVKAKAKAKPYRRAASKASGGSVKSNPVDSLDLFWSIARFDLGLTDLEFLEEAPRSLDLQIERLKRREFKDYQIGAKVSCILANVNRDTTKKPEPFTELDFIPEYLWPD